MKDKGVGDVKEILVVGVGPGDLRYLTLEALQVLENNSKIFFRTAKHEVIEDLKKRGVSFTTYDYLYDEKNSFLEVYHCIVQDLLQQLEIEKTNKIVYGVPGHPLFAERSVRLLLEEAGKRNVKITLIPGMSFIDCVCSSLKIDPIDGLLILDALEVDEKMMKSSQHTVFTQVYSRLVASDLKLILLEVYDPHHPVVIIKSAGLDDERKENRKISELDHIDWFDHLTSVYVPPQAKDESIEKDDYLLNPLVEVMNELLSPQGCPWDREQNHKSLKPYLLEEAYEVIEAIDCNDMNKLQEELGDLLLQVVFHSILAQKRGDFTVNEVVEIVTEKMIRRHPHVFGNTIVKDTKEVLINWEQIKALEKQDSKKEKMGINKVMDKVNRSLPALLMAEEIQKKAKKVGFDWHDYQGALNKLKEEVLELEEALLENGNIEEEIGDVLFAAVNVARFAKISPEAALFLTVSKFIQRFNYIESALRQKGIEWQDVNLDGLDSLWNEAKDVGL